MFNGLPFQVSTSDGRNFALLAPVTYQAKDGTLYRLPVGATSDGASTPPEVWPLIPPFGLFWPAAFLHDCAYRGTLEVLNGSAWIKANVDEARADELILEAMEALGVGLIERETIYRALRVFGHKAFVEDRKAALSSPSPT